MSIKSLFQIIIICFIILIIGSVYIKYFDNDQNIVEETNTSETKNLEQIKELEKKLLDLEIKNQELNNKIKNSNSKNVLEEKKKKVEDNKEVNRKIETEENAMKNEKKKLDSKNDENAMKNEKKKLHSKNDENATKNEKKKVDTKTIKNLVKDVEYTSVDEKGNKFYLLANSAKSNPNNKDILDLDNVRGKITSDKRDTIYIVSDYAQYDTINLNSKFYENVIINYQDKVINCLNFDINMDTNKAVAYNDVIITDPKSIMKAGIVEFDLKTKDIVINPENTNSDIQVITN